MLNLIRRLYYIAYYQSSSDRYIEYLRKCGVKVGTNCIFRGPRSSEVDVSRPSLVEIGDYVDMNINFTILTHDYVTSVFLRKYKQFINSSGKVKIGNNIYFGKNCTVLKGVTIGDNCVIGASSLVVKSIPPNSVAAGVPARVICSIDEYFQKRKEQALEEAFEYTRSIKERFNRMPIESDFREEFPFFIDGSEADNHPSVPIRFQMMEAYDYWSKNHKAQFGSLEEFLKAAGL